MPAVPGHFGVQLPDFPPRIAERDKPFSGSLRRPNHAQDINRCGHAPEVERRFGRRDAPIEAVQHKAPIWINRTAIINGAIGNFVEVDIKLFQQAVERHTRKVMPNPDTKRAFFIVRTERHDRLVKARIAYAGHGEKEVPRQTVRFHTRILAQLCRAEKTIPAKKMPADLGGATGTNEGVNRFEAKSPSGRRVGIADSPGVVATHLGRGGEIFVGVGFRG